MAEVHIVKLSVGTKSVETLQHWQASGRALTRDGFPCHITRMWPKREAELLDGGSIYWVIQGQIQCRQRLIRFDEVTASDGTRHCGFVLDPEIVRVAPTQRRPFQGWRYLPADQAPPDLSGARRTDEALPDELAQKLAEIGVL